MKVETKVSGLIEVPDDHIINIPAGLLGFEEYTDFALYDSVYPPFVWMQSIQEKNLAFLMIDPFLICGGYRNCDLIDYTDSDVSFMFNLGAGGGAMILKKN